MSELNRLRCRLRAVNIEYSALVRRKTGEAVYARMAELRAERHVLMALIALEREAALAQLRPWRSDFGRSIARALEDYRVVVAVRLLSRLLSPGHRRKAWRPQALT